MALHTRRTELVAGGAIFGAMSSILTLANIAIPFPPLPYLTFDFGQIPVVIATLLYGPLAGTISVVEYFGILELVGSFRPVGPILRLLATGSIVLAIYVAGRVYSRLASEPKLKRFTLISLGLSSLFTIPIMTIANIVVLLILFPFFLTYANASLGTFLGINFVGESGLFIIILFTVIYNFLQLLITIIPSTGLSTVAVLRRHGYVPTKYWIARYIPSKTDKI
ncbi:MAG: hypothetical protein QXG05_02595 [Nitrososphaerota archaeon]